MSSLMSTTAMEGVASSSGQQRPTFVKKMSRTVLEEETTEVVVDFEGQPQEGIGNSGRNASGSNSASANNSGSASTLTARPLPVPFPRKLARKRTRVRIDEIEELAVVPEDADVTPHSASANNSGSASTLSLTARPLPVPFPRKLVKKRTLTQIDTIEEVAVEDADVTPHVQQKRSKTFFQEATSTYAPAPTYTEKVGVAEYRGSLLVAERKRKREEGQGGKPWYERLLTPLTPASWWAGKTNAITKEKRQPQLELCDGDQEDARAAKRLKVAPAASSSSTSDPQDGKDDSALVHTYVGWINFFTEDGVPKNPTVGQDEDDNQLVNQLANSALGFFCNELKRD